MNDPGAASQIAPVTDPQPPASVVESPAEVVPYDRFLEVIADRHVAEAQADRVELTVFRVAKGGQMAVARTRRHPGGVEPSIAVGEHRVWSKVYPPDRMRMLDSDIEIQRSQFINSGWSSVEA